MRGRRYLLRIVPSLVLLVLFAFHVTGHFNLQVIEKLEQFAYDARLRLTAPEGVDPRVVILDIDERSLREEGHWPWARDKMTVSDIAKLRCLPAFAAGFSARGCEGAAGMNGVAVRIIGQAGPTACRVAGSRREESGRVGMQGTANQVLCVRHLDKAATVHDAYAIAQVRYQVEVVGYEEIRQGMTFLQIDEPAHRRGE